MYICVNQIVQVALGWAEGKGRGHLSDQLHPNHWESPTTSWGIDFCWRGVEPVNLYCKNSPRKFPMCLV